jgi:hypothetical protein
VPRNCLCSCVSVGQLRLLADRPASGMSLVPQQSDMRHAVPGSMGVLNAPLQKPQRGHDWPEVPWRASMSARPLPHCLRRPVPGPLTGRVRRLPIWVRPGADSIAPMRRAASPRLRCAARRVLLHQAVQRGLLGAVVFVVDRGAIGSPLGVLRRGSHDGLPVGCALTVSSCAPCLNRVDGCQPKCALRRRPYYGWLRGCPTGSFRAARSGRPMSLQGRVPGLTRRC